MSADSSKPSPASGPVQLLPSARGSMKAMYSGRTFRLVRNNSVRYYWNCELRHCSSRLTTDAYGKEHMVYSFQPHDEDEHRRAEKSKKRQRSDAVHKQKPLKRIKDCDYVLEKQEGSTHFWRCKFRKCTGRCRTTCDGVLVAGPSPHSEEVHANHPTTPEDFGTPGAVERDHLQDYLPDIRQGSEDTYCERRQEYEHEQKKQQREEDEEATEDDDADKQDDQKKRNHEQEGQSSKPPIVVKLVFSSKQCWRVKRQSMPPSASPAATADDIGREDSREHTTDARGRDASISTNMDRVTPVIKQGEADVTVHDVGRVDIPSSEDDAENKLSHSSDVSECGDDDDKSSQLDACYPDKNGGCANDERSYKSADSMFRDQSRVPSAGYQGRCEQALEMALDSREMELRASILVQMRRLLEAESQLADRKHQVEVLRKRVLKQQRKNLVSLRAPAQPDKLPSS
ncbi:uncharacterized protein LOC144096989 [Amblyomma americanum]